ncbi:MAG TPA: VWA domain-containing protein, partial [Gammaproteobacteria bacterium]
MNMRPIAGGFLAGSLLILALLAACARPLTEPDEQRVAEQETRAHRTELADARDAMKQRERLAMPMIAAGYAPPPWATEPPSRENYAHHDDNPVQLAAETPVSTFSVDVDTGSYANLRRWLNEGRLPPMDAVRVEEMINYFNYAYAPPASREQPFSVTTTLAPAPWNENALLLQVGLKGYAIERSERPAANLVFLVDVSGSMQSPDKLDLLKQGLGLLVSQLEARDRVSLVVYAGASGVVLPPTAGDRKGEIRAALSQLAAGGSTNGAAGIRLAYDMARQGFIENGINRVLLATDGDFNVGTVNFEELVDLVERERDSGITLTTLGFGTGNYNDQLMEQLADKGNGNYAYIDTAREAQKLLVEEMSATMFVIANDVKAQVEFNPALVAEYRLIGYENRLLNREDFNNDKVDAGDIGAGHTVTALYEIVLADSEARRVDDLRYRAADVHVQVPHPDDAELAWLKLRYKLPGETHSRLIEQPVQLGAELPLANTNADFRFAAAVAAFGQKLRGGKY